MKQFHKIFILFSLTFTHLLLPFKAIMFDIETIFETDKMKASKYVGKMDSLKFSLKLGHLPNQEHLFDALEGMKTETTLRTYNNNLKMPLVLSEWLLNNKSRSKLLQAILAYLSKSDLSDIEIKVFGNIVDMMLTPEKLVDTEKVISESLKIIGKLKQDGYKVYLVGNWSHINSLKEEFPEVFSKFNGIFVSGTMHLLKPYQDFYTHILNATGLLADNVIWIEKEAKFIQAAKGFGYYVATFNQHKPKHLYQELEEFNIFLK